jgi:hypothetical protein
VSTINSRLPGQQLLLIHSSETSYFLTAAYRCSCCPQPLGTVAVCQPRDIRPLYWSLRALVSGGTSSAAGCRLCSTACTLSACRASAWHAVQHWN